MYQTDVLIIGAGAVGVALARELSKYRLRVMVCDKNDDVGGDASKSCSSCVATQATMPTGSLEHEVTSGGGVKLLGFFNAGFMGLGMKSVDSENFADLTGTSAKSQLMRCPAADSYNLTMKAMGFNTTVIPYSDLYSALQNGLCEGWLGGSGLVNYDSFRDAIKYFVDCNVINECIPVMMNAKLFDSLPEEYQTIIVDVFAQMQTRVNEERAEQEAKAVEDMTAYGITVIQPTADELAALRDRIRAEVWPQMANTLGQDIIDNLCQTYNVSLS